MVARPDWPDYWIQIAHDVATRATCLRRKYGAVIIDSLNTIVSTGYCGAPRGEANCIDIGICDRERLEVPSGERYELCRSVHGEMNAVIQGDAVRMVGGTIYIAGFDARTGEPVDACPCKLCLRAIRNAQIRTIVYRKVRENGEVYLSRGLNPEEGR